MTPLGREIAALISAEGPIDVARYMTLCLSHPAHGYYATRDPFGPGGDFVTAPEISQMFGELVGLWCAEVWARMGRPERFRLVELGPGRGTLMADMLRAARAAPGFLDAAEIVLVETSPTLREIQARTLSGADLRWAATVEEALGEQPRPGGSEAESRERPQEEAPTFTSPQRREVARRSRAGEGVQGFTDSARPPRPALRADLSPPGRGEGPPLTAREPGQSTCAALCCDEPPLPAIVVSNEFFDALPVRQFAATPEGWRERLVGLRDGALAFGHAPEAPDLRLPDAPVGAVREVSPDAVAIAASLAGHVAAHGGAALAIDYGYASGFGDTLQAVRGHGFADPLAEPGEADLTAHVDFGALAAAARTAGAAVAPLLSQADFLERLGLPVRAAALSRTAPARRDEIMAAAARLTDRTPTGMGALFKALAFAQPCLAPLPAFDPDGAAP